MDTHLKEIRSLKEKIKETLQNPDKIIASLKDEKARFYYKYYKQGISANKFLMVLIKYFKWRRVYHNSIFCKKNKMKQSIDIYYDEEGDYLEVSFGVPPEKEDTEELGSEEVLITRDENTNEVKSIGIVAFKKRAKEEILKRVLKQLEITMPLDITIP